MQIEETIVATASTHDGGGLRGIVRISGKDAVPTVATLFECEDREIELDAVNSSRRIPGTLCVRAPIGEVTCDLYLWPTARSYTRQPVAELHTYGAIPLLNAVVETVCQHGARLARPGEFTLRAFLAGRIDLAQAEAVLGVIDAVDNRELSVALSQLAAGLSRPLDIIRNTLLNLCADLEAGLDFVEDDIEFVSKETIEQELRSANQIVTEAQRRMHSRDAGGQLPRVVLRGEPNTGKSSLWNALCADAKAIVTDQAGTTRDYLTGTVEADHIRFTLIDTAGVEHGDAPLQRTLRGTTDRQSETSELILICIDSSRPLSEWERMEIDTVASANRLVVLTKCDLLEDPSIRSVPVDVRMSNRDKSSSRELVLRCGDVLESMALESTVVSSTAVRCRDSLRLANESIERSLSLTQADAGNELIAAEVRTSLEHLGQIVGVIYTDDILDRVFSRFCIGK